MSDENHAHHCGVCNYTYDTYKAYAGHQCAALASKVGWQTIVRTVQESVQTPGAHDSLYPESPLTTTATEGLRHDSGKTRLDLLCPIAMWGIGDVLTKGAKKYAPNNWTKGMPWSKVIGPLLRHLFLFMRGYELDKDENCEECKTNACTNHTGLPHVDLIACNAMFLQNYYRRHKSLDDRLKTVDEHTKN